MVVWAWLNRDSNDDNKEGYQTNYLNIMHRPFRMYSFASFSKQIRGQIFQGRVYV